MKKLEIVKTKPTFTISTFKTDIIKVGLVFSISNFFIAKKSLANNWRSFSSSYLALASWDFFHPTCLIYILLDTHLNCRFHDKPSTSTQNMCILSTERKKKLPISTPIPLQVLT